MIRKTRKTLIR